MKLNAKWVGLLISAGWLRLQYVGIWNVVQGFEGFEGLVRQIGSNVIMQNRNRRRVKEKEYTCTYSFSVRGAVKLESVVARRTAKNRLEQLISLEK
jgi:hypothetical protein